MKKLIKPLAIIISAITMTVPAYAKLMLDNDTF